MKRLARQLNLWYCITQGIFFVLPNCCIIYASMFLLERGFRNTEIGIILAVAYILGLVLQPVVTSMADSSRRLTPVGFLAVVAAAEALVCIGLACLRTRSLAVAVLYALFIALYEVMIPLLNAFAFYLARTKVPIHYGLSRGCGAGVWGISMQGLDCIQISAASPQVDLVT